MLHTQPRLILLDINASNIRQKAPDYIILFSHWHRTSFWFKCFLVHFVPITCSLRFLQETKFCSHIDNTTYVNILAV
jgi:hypothetical protein